MDPTPRLVQIIYTHPFVAAAKGLLSQDELRELELQLIERPDRGVIMQGTGGVRKMRFALPGRGKSGGARVLYLFEDADGTIYLMDVFRKSEKVSLTKAEQNVLREVVRAIRQEG